jgi:general secretion pathway protein J
LFLINTKKYEGFTLLEILIAILIFALIMTVLFSSFKAFVVSSEAVRESVTQNEAVQAVFRRIRLDLEGVYVQQPPQYKKPEFDSEPDPYRFAGQEDRFSFSSLAHAGFQKNEKLSITRITYYMKENTDHTFDLYRSHILPPFPEDEDSCNDPLVCRGILGFEAGFADDTGERHKTWDSDSEVFDYAFPACVDLKITFVSGEKKQVVEASFKVPVERRLFE